MAGRKSRYEFDVFMSHRGSDKTLVENLAARLHKDEGLRPFLDKWHLIPGEPWQEALETALNKSATCAVFLGASGLGPWENVEMRSALDRHVRDKSIRVILVLLPGANINGRHKLPDFLRLLTWVDFRSGMKDKEAFRQLVAGIRGIAPGRGETPPESSISKLESSDSLERTLAAKQLGGLKDQAVILILEKRWPQEPDGTVRHWLALAIGEIGGQTAIEALHRVRKNESDVFALMGIDDALREATEKSV